MPLTDQQERIISTFTRGRNTLVNASPGSGKTWTLVEAARALPRASTVLALAFNKSIATNLQEKFVWNPNAKAATTHSDAYSFFPGRRPQVDTRKLHKIITALYPNLNPLVEDTIVKMVNCLKDQAVGITTPASSDLLLHLDQYYSLGFIETTEDEELGETQASITEKTLTVFDKSISDLSTIDFQDMLYIPIRQKMPYRYYKYVLCDEVQDFSPLQIAYLEYRAKNSIVLLVGDKKQSAYGFRGADAEAFPRLQSAFEAVELPMNKTFRCPIAVCDEANKIFTDSMIPMTTKQGEVDSVSSRDLLQNPMNFIAEDTILMCRTNAPLFALAIKMLKHKQPVRVPQKMATAVLSAVKRCKAATLGDLKHKLEINQERESKRTMSILALANIQDKYEVLYDLIAESTSVKGVIDTLNSLLTSQKGPLFTSIHSGKGLEAQHAIIYRYDLLPHPRATKEWEAEQEKNLAFIAVTRALQTLTYA